jgi:hypothetical protein
MYSGLFVFLLFFLSCGIDEYVYLEPVPMGSVRSRQGNPDIIDITLPNSFIQSPEFFRNYSIFYKIYLSNYPPAGSISIDDYDDINPTLNSDYIAIEPYTNVTPSDTSISPQSVERVFSSRDYKKIAVEGENIDTLLDNTTDNKILALDFSDTANIDNPVLTLDGGDSYILRRAIESFASSNTFNNNEILLSSAIPDDNDDAAMNIENATECYVMLYIVKEGIDINFSRIYSFPTSIGLFRLPS